MTNVSFQHKKKIWKRTLPDTWNDLSKKQLLQFSRLLLNPYDWNDQLRKIILLHRLLKLPSKAFFSINLAITDELFGKVKFLFEDCTLTKCIINKFWIRKVLYIGPHDKFGNVDVSEYGWWDKYYVQYCQSKDPRDLSMAIACMYRPISFWKWLIPAKAAEDKRIAFSMHTLEKRADKIAALPADVRHAIFLQFTGIRNQITTKYKRVFRQVEEHPRHPVGWLDVMTDLAGPQFGTVPQVQKSNAIMVLNFLEKAEIKRERQESQPVKNP